MIPSLDELTQRITDNYDKHVVGLECALSIYIEVAQGKRDPRTLSDSMLLFAVQAAIITIHHVKRQNES